MLSQWGNLPYISLISLKNTYLCPLLLYIINTANVYNRIVYKYYIFGSNLKKDFYLAKELECLFTLLSTYLKFFNNYIILLFYGIHSCVIQAHYLNNPGFV